MLFVIALVLLGVGFCAFIALSSKEATEMMLASLWFLMAVAMLSSICWTVLKPLFV